MADIKSAQQLLKDVPKNDALKALAEITDWIESVRDDAHFNLDQRLEILSFLDESARPHMRKLVYDYFSTLALSQFQENRTWMALNEFFAQIEQAYFRVLTGYCKGDKGSSAIKSSLPLVSARGIHAVMGRLKFAVARYTQVDQETWQHLAEYYAHAETQNYLNEPILLYPGLAPTTSTRNEFVGLLMWYAAGAGTFSPQNMHLAERLAAHFCRRFKVETYLASDSLFYFDLSHPSHLTRVMPETTPLAGMRFLSAGDVAPQIDTLLKVLVKNIVPDEINFGGVYQASSVRDVARHLATYWAAPMPMRRNVRRPIKVDMNVAHGFANVVRLADPAAGDKTGMLPAYPIGGADNVSAGMTWAVEDISATGFRCVLQTKNAEGVKIGSLIGIRPENVGHKGVGIVRRLSRDNQNNLHVGVEMLGKQVENVVLRAQGRSLMGAGQTALWLIKPDDHTGEVCLLMNPDTFSINTSLHTQFDEKNYLLIPLALLEKGVDYDLARYRKVEEDINWAAESY